MTLPRASARGTPEIEVPLARLFVLGVRVGVLGWTTELEHALDYPAHVLLDLSLLPKVRLPVPLASTTRVGVMEVYFGVPGGLSFDHLGKRDRSLTQESAGWSTGVHLGALLGARFAQTHTDLGAYVELGLIWRSIRYTLDYRNEAGDAYRYHVSAHPGSMLLGLGIDFDL